MPRIPILIYFKYKHILRNKLTSSIPFDTFECLSNYYKFYGRFVMVNPQEFKIDNYSLLVKFKEELSAIVNDLNNILVGIVGNARFIKEEGLVKREGLGLIESILSCADRSKYLTGQLQDLENIVADKESEILNIELIQSGNTKDNVHILEQSNNMNLTCDVPDTILIIDDEEVVRNVSRTILEKRGFQVLSTSSGEEGIEIYKQNPSRIKCVLLDLTMPFMPGNLVFARLKARDPNVRVVLMSGYSDKQAMSEFNEGSIAGFLQKPFSPYDLTQIIEHAGLKSPSKNVAVH